MNRSGLRVAAYLLLACMLTSLESAAKLGMREPVKLANGELLKAIYFFPHWWDPWKSDDAALTADLVKMKDLGLNTVCVDHEVSQAIDREWYWLDREYKLVGREGMFILPWLQLHSLDRTSLMKFSHLELKQAVNQEKQPQEDCVVYRDGAFKKALTHYISVYLDRYRDDPALLRIKDRGKLRPVVGLMLEAGWRNADGLPLSFDEETNAYFRKWMRATYHDMRDLNSKWGTKYKSFDEIDPCDRAVFNYDHKDKKNMPPPVREHVRFRARLINDALKDVAEQVRKRHRDVLFVVEVAYPFGSEDPKASAYRWNNANEYKAIESADILLVRTLGDACSKGAKKDFELMMLGGKRVILAYRLFDGSSTENAVSLALDCASSANGLAYYNWNETKDPASAAYNKPERQTLLRLMTITYDRLHGADAKPSMTTAPAQVAPAPAEPAPSPAGPAGSEQQ